MLENGRIQICISDIVNPKFLEGEMKEEDSQWQD